MEQEDKVKRRSNLHSPIRDELTIPPLNTEDRVIATVQEHMNLLVARSERLERKCTKLICEIADLKGRIAAASNLATLRADIAELKKQDD